MYQEKYMVAKKKYLSLGGDNNEEVNVISHNKLIFSIDNGFIFMNEKSYLIYDLLRNNSDKIVYKLLDITSNQRLRLVYQNSLWKITETDESKVLHEFISTAVPSLELFSRKKKIVILIRHGQSEGNIGIKDHNPNLSDKGHFQSKELSEILVKFNDLLKSSTDISGTLYKYNSGIQKIVISPLKRTLMTAMPLLYKLTEIPVTSTFYCTEYAQSSHEDVGFSKYSDYKNYTNSVLNLTKSGRKLKEISDDEKNYSLWYDKIWKDIHSKQPDKELCEERCKLLSEYIKNSEEKVIVIFTHSNLIRHFFNIKLGKSIMPIINNTSFISFMHE